MLDVVKIFIELRNYLIQKIGGIIEFIIVNAGIAKTYIQTNFMEFLFGSLTVLWVIGMFKIFNDDPYKITTVYPSTMTSFALFGFFVFVMTFLFVKARKQIFKDVPNASKQDNYPSIFSFNLKVVVIMVAGYILFNSGKRILFKILEQGAIKDVITVTYNIVLIAGALALINKVLTSTILNSFKKTKSLGLLVVNVIMYVPCIITDIFEKIHNELKITPSVTYTILLIEAIVLGLGFLVPFLISYMVEKNGVILQKDPIYLNNRSVIASIPQLKPTNVNMRTGFNKDEKTQNYNLKSWFGFSPDKEVDYNYSITSWVRINPQPPNARANGNDFIQILSYDGKPDLYYNPKINRIEVRVKKDNGDETVVYATEQFPLQKWNHFVLNFNSGTLDVFMNGELITSQPGLLTRMSRKPITVGDDNGVQGGIRNVMYFPYILSKQEIDVFYKSQK